MAKTVNKHIRIEVSLWERLDSAARDRETTANRLLAELATQWLNNREWPATDVQVQVARSSLFTAQAMVRNLIAEKRENEIEEIRRYISKSFPMYPWIHRPRTSGTRKPPIPNRMIRRFPASPTRVGAASVGPNRPCANASGPFNPMTPGLPWHFPTRPSGYTASRIQT